MTACGAARHQRADGAAVLSIGCDSGGTSRLRDLYQRAPCRMLFPDVEAGEPLGVLPVKGDAKPQLYFEWRHNSEPIDPSRGIALSKRR